MRHSNIEHLITSMSRAHISSQGVRKQPNTVMVLSLRDRLVEIVLGDNAHTSWPAWVPSFGIFLRLCPSLMLLIVAPGHDGKTSNEQPQMPPILLFDKKNRHQKVLEACLMSSSPERCKHSQTLPIHKPIVFWTRGNTFAHCFSAPAHPLTRIEGRIPFDKSYFLASQEDNPRDHRQGARPLLDKVG